MQIFFSWSKGLLLLLFTPELTIYDKKDSSYNRPIFSGNSVTWTIWFAFYYCCFLRIRLGPSEGTWPANPSQKVQSPLAQTVDIKNDADDDVKVWFHKDLLLFLVGQMTRKSMSCWLLLNLLFIAKWSFVWKGSFVEKRNKIYCPCFIYANYTASLLNTQYIERNHWQANKKSNLFRYTATLEALKERTFAQS